MTCAYCGAAFGLSPERRATWDHVWPRARFDHTIRARGGLDGRVRACSGCNSEKNDLTLEEWLALLRPLQDPRVPLIERVARRFRPPSPTRAPRGPR